MIAAALFLCTVASVHDGDTLRCMDGTRIRLHAIDTPEMPGACRKGRKCAPGNPYRAKAALERLALRKTLRCEKTGMSYSRVTAYCSIDEVDISCAMVRSGHAIRVAKYDQQRRLCRTP